ncbi:MAG: 16S rRNA (guanine(527)-N(7))-methyltransferase RsmG [Ruminococcaceae bacterium]|nr:16S rRNA (guanine(527)-N(7))-methyltransferase RsmG [Oscillospiraceae bacterium]
MNTIKDLISNNADKYYKFYSLLTEWNEKMNLTAITDEYSVATKHFLDCMAIFDHVEFKEGASVIDVGCGAGFPSAVMAIERPDLKITMLDSLNKRLNFLNCVIEEVPLPNCSTLHARAEEFANKKEYREKFDFAVSRAVANLASLCELCMGYVKVGGYFVALKGPSVSEEIKMAETAIKKLGGELQGVINYSIPTTDLCHNLVVIKKVKPMEKKYPRKSPKPIKEPIM